MTSWPGTAKNSSPFSSRAREHLRHEPRQQLGQRVGERVREVRHRRIVGVARASTVSTSSAPSWSRSTVLISASIWSQIASWFCVFFTMCSRRIAMRMPLQRLRRRCFSAASLTEKLAYGCSGIERLRQRGERIARIEVAASPDPSSHRAPSRHRRACAHGCRRGR